MPPVRGILERPAAQRDANPWGLSRFVDLFLIASFVDFADIDHTAGGTTGISGKPPCSIRLGVKQRVFPGFVARGRPETAPLGSPLGGGGALLGGRAPRAARRRVPGPAIAMAQPGTFPGSLGAVPLARNFRGPAADSASRRAVVCVVFGPCGSRSARRRVQGPGARRPDLGLPPDRPSRFMFKPSPRFSLLSGLRCLGVSPRVPDARVRSHAGVI